jgi:hypothetical protein
MDWVERAEDNMKRTWTIIGLFVVVFLLAVSIHVLRGEGQEGATTSPAVPSAERARLAVEIVRYINTAEMDCRLKDGKLDENARFFSWDELLDAPFFGHMQDQFSQAHGQRFSPGPEIVPGLELRLVVSADGKHYNLWLGQKKDIDCGFAFYSDERGVIYEGKAIGCEVAKSTL